MSPHVRAMYTDPDFALCGVGRMILAACEAAAAAEGFCGCELAATLAGEPLFLAYGYHQIERFREPRRRGSRRRWCAWASSWALAAEHRAAAARADRHAQRLGIDQASRTNTKQIRQG
jgi:GNAT superfamily N-acetyltransferase